MVTAQRADGRLALAAVSVAVLTVLALPLLWSVGRVPWTTSGTYEWNLWWPSLSLAAQAACMSLLLSCAGLWASALHGKMSWVWLPLAVTAACALPSYVHALAWSWLLPPKWLEQEQIVAACVLGAGYAPVSFLVLVVALRASSRRMSEAAWMAGLSPLRTQLLLARRAIPPLLAAWLIAFLLSFADFPVADHFRVPTYATEVFARVAAWLDAGAAARLALPILITTIVVTGLLVRAFSRMPSSLTPVGDDRSSQLPLRQRAARWLAGSVFVAIVIGIPLAALISRVPTLATITSALRALWPDLPATILLGLGVGVLASVLGAVLSYAGARRIHASARFGRLFAWVALAWPASLVCLGAISLAASPVFRDTVFEWLPLIAVLLLRWLVLPYEVWSSFWNRMPVSLEESGWLAGQPWWGTLTQLLWKHGAAPFAASVLLTACFAINDLSVFVLLAPPGFSTTTLNIFSAVHYGPSSYLAALSLCQVLIVAALATTALSLGFQPTRAAR